MTKKQRIKVISLGDTNSGKSCIIRRFCEGRFLQTYMPTIGIDYGVKEMKMNVDNEKIDLCVHFWDFSGDSDYAEIVNEFFDDNIDAVFIVYDITNRQHFNSVEKWMQESKIAGVEMEKVPFVLCANKVDCSNARKVSREEGEKLALANHMDFFETSSCTGKNVEEMMVSIFQKALKRRME